MTISAGDIFDSQFIISRDATAPHSLMGAPRPLYSNNHSDTQHIMAIHDMERLLVAPYHLFWWRHNGCETWFITSAPSCLVTAPVEYPINMAFIRFYTVISHSENWFTLVWVGVNAVISPLKNSFRRFMIHNHSGIQHIMVIHDNFCLLVAPHHIYWWFDNGHETWFFPRRNLR